VGLVEVIAATIVAVVAILALAYTFGMGRGLLNGYQSARVALAIAQRRMEILGASASTSGDLTVGSHPAGGPRTVQVDGQNAAVESWMVAWYDDRADGAYTGSNQDLKTVTVKVSWGRQTPTETVTITRLFPAP
jgi:hypothetical protein